MTAEEHNKTLATLWFIYGAMHGLTLVALLLLVFAVKMATPGNLISTFWITVGVVTFVVLLLLVGLLPLLVGYALRKRRRWAKPLGISLAVVSLINIPVGTALGILGGYLGGWVDSLLMRITDISLAFPGILIALLFAINMFSWDGELWFQWPTLAILFVFCLRVIRLYRA